MCTATHLPNLLGLGLPLGAVFIVLDGPQLTE